MTQNIYDTSAFFDAYAKLDRSVRGLAGAPEWPTLSAMLPSVAGFALERIEEWGPSDADLAAHPSWAGERQRPPFLLVAARASA